MNLQSLVAVLLRLASLNFLLQMVVQFIIRLDSVTNAYRDLPRAEVSLAIVTPLLVIMGLLIGAVLLWVFALPLARFITRGLPSELSLGALTLADCYALVFVGLGLFYMIGYFAPVLNWIHYLLKMEGSRPDDSWRQQVNWYDISVAFITFIVGIVLLVNGRKWGVALANRHARNAVEPTPSHPEQSSS